MNHDGDGDGDLQTTRIAALSYATIFLIEIQWWFYAAKDIIAVLTAPQTRQNSRRTEPKRTATGFE
jgi:hypothetical protein